MDIEFSIFPTEGRESEFSITVDLPSLPRVGDVVGISGQPGWGERKKSEDGVFGAVHDFTSETPEQGSYGDFAPGFGTCVVRAVKWLINRDVPLGSKPKLTKVCVELEMAEAPYNSDGFKASMNRHRQRDQVAKEVE